MKLPHITHSLLALCATSFVAVIGFGTGAMLVLSHEGALPWQETASALSALPPQINPGVLSAKSAIVYDPSDGTILYQRDAKESLPLASITKLMTAEVVLTAENPDTPITITPTDLTGQGNWGFKVGDVVTLNNLLKMGLIASSNDAMEAAATSLGSSYLARMNATAANLGLTQTRFLDPTGLDISTSTSGAYSSAYDVARLAALFYKQHPDYFELTQSSSVSIPDGGRTLSAEATAASILSTPGLIAAKTGYTDLADGNLVAIFDVDIGHPLVAVVLGSTHTGRFSDIKSLISAAQSAYRL